MPKHTVTSYTPPNSKTVAAKVRRDCCEPYGGRTRTRPSVRLPKVWWSYSNSRYKCASSPTTWLPATSTHCVHYWSMETAKQRMDASSEVASIFALSHAPSPPSGQPPSNAPPSPPLLQISVLHHVQYRKRILSVIRQHLPDCRPSLMHILSGCTIALPRLWLPSSGASASNAASAAPSIPQALTAISTNLV